MPEPKDALASLVFIAGVALIAGGLAALRALRRYDLARLRRDSRGNTPEEPSVLQRLAAERKRNQLLDAENEELRARLERRKHPVGGRR